MNCPGTSPAEGGRSPCSGAKLIALRLDIQLASPAPDEKIDTIVRIASRATTVVSTLRVEALDVEIG